MYFVDILYIFPNNTRYNRIHRTIILFCIIIDTSNIFLNFYRILLRIT
jgi:hypothetical protein